PAAALLTSSKRTCARRGERQEFAVAHCPFLLFWPAGLEAARMRDDMAKVVTERPRRGHAEKSKKTTGRPIRRYDPDADYEEPTRLPISRGRQYGCNAKEFSDLINPLKRYLRSCIGRPWNKVHSELSQKLDRRSLSGSHIWDHVMWEIETDCFIGPDGLAYRNNCHGGVSDCPVVGLYVHPRTGLIREQPRRVARR